MRMDSVTTSHDVRLFARRHVEARERPYVTPVAVKRDSISMISDANWDGEEFNLILNGNVQMRCLGRFQDAYAWWTGQERPADIPYTEWQVLDWPQDRELQEVVMSCSIAGYFGNIDAGVSIIDDMRFGIICRLVPAVECAVERALTHYGGLDEHGICGQRNGSCLRFVTNRLLYVRDQILKITGGQ